MSDKVRSALSQVELARDKHAKSIQALSPSTSTNITVSGSSAGGALPDDTELVRLSSTANCYVVFGAGSTPTATTSDMLFPAGVEVVVVPFGMTHIAVIGAGGSTGLFSATKME